MVEERNVAFGHYMEITTPVCAKEKNLGCIYVRWSTSDEVGHRVCSNVYIPRAVKVENCMN